MATVGEVTTRAQAEAPACCNQPMSVTDLGAERGVHYQCKTCLSSANGRRSDDIARDIDKGTLKPVSQQKEAPVNRPTSSGAASTAQEHNAALLKRTLADIGGVLTRGTDIINNLNRRNGVLVGQVAAAGEFAVATEQTDRSKHALDETAGLTSAMDQHLGGMSGAVSEAEVAVAAAVGGLRVVEEAEDELRQAGAGTKAAAPARDGA